MKPIYIPHLLQAADRTRSLTFETFFSDLETLTPVRAQVAVRHGTTFLEVQGQAQAIVTLTCDRCLQRYNYRLSVDAQEMIWLDNPPETPQEQPLEQEIAPEDLVESLSPQGYFEPDTWIYEQVCLKLPQRQICDPQCRGLIAETPAEETPAEEAIDHRWAALAALKQYLTTEDTQS